MVFYHFRIAVIIHFIQNMIAQGPTSTSVRVLNKKREHMQCLLVREWGGGGGVAEEAGAAPPPAGGRQQRHSSLADSEDNASDEESSGVKLKVKGIRSNKVSGSLLPVQW